MEIESSILMLALAAATIVKASIDMIKMAVETPQWLPPLVAVAGGVAVVLLLLIASGEAITQQVAAQAVLAGILAGASAVGVTELAKRTLPGK